MNDSDPAREVRFRVKNGFFQTKTNKFWEANSIDPKTKFMLELTFGTRTEDQIKDLMTSTKKRLAQITDLLVITDGLSSYNTLFPEVFGVPYAIARSRKQRLSGRKQSLSKSFLEVLLYCNWLNSTKVIVWSAWMNA